MLIFLLSLLESDADKQKLTELYELHHEAAEKKALHILKDQHDAEDAVQNTFIQIIRHFDKVYEIPCKNLRFWIISIVKNESLMILRKKSRTVPVEDWGSFAEQSGSAIEYEELVQLFSQLPETYRAALEMRFLLNCSGKEIAGRLGISEAAVNTRISRGRALLRTIAEKEGFRI